MKKQLFILILAVFASVTVAFGQQTTNFSAPTALTGCTNGALNPIAGKEYSYSTVLNPAGGTATWRVVAGNATQQFINNGTWVAPTESAGGSYILSTTPSIASPLTSATSPSTVSITWNSTGLATVIAAPTTNKLFVTVEYTGTTCANNFQAWEIKPQNAFTIDVYNVKDDLTLTASGNTISSCYSAITSAVYNATPNVTMDYGTNTITYEVVAANFTGTFSPTFQLSGLTSPQKADISWGYTAATANANSIATNADNGTFGPIVASASSSLNTTLGCSIFVQVLVHNHGYEGTSDAGITLAATATSAGQNDVTTACADDPGYSDFATHDLLKRPTINGEVPATFIPKN